METNNLIRSMTNPSNLCLDKEDPPILLTKCNILDTVNEIKDLIESVPNRENNQTQKSLHDKQEKIKNILKDAYTEVRKSQSQIIEKVNQVKYLTRRTEILKSELANSLKSTYTSKSGLSSDESQNDTSKNIEDIMFFNKLLTAQENIDLLLMDSLFESINTVDVIDSIHKLRDGPIHTNTNKTAFSQDMRIKSESLHQLVSDNRAKWPSQYLTSAHNCYKGNSFDGLMKKWNKKYGSSNDVSQSDDELYYSMRNSFNSNSSLCFSSSDLHLENRRKLSRSKSLNDSLSSSVALEVSSSSLKLNKSHSLNELDHREWKCTLKSNSLTNSRFNQSDEEFFSIDSNFKTASMDVYTKDDCTQFDSVCSLNSSENTSGFHSFSNLKTQDEESFSINAMVTSTAKKSNNMEIECVRRNTFISENKLSVIKADIINAQTVVSFENRCQKFREINIFSSFFLLFVYFDLRIFLFFVAVFNWIKNMFSRN
jgi:hypothetical protein